MNKFDFDNSRPGASPSATEPVNDARSPSQSRTGLALEKDRAREGGAASDNFSVSGALGLPLLANDPAPLSSALHAPVLTDESTYAHRRDTPEHADNAAPFSSMLHMPTLVNESKPQERDRANEFPAERLPPSRNPASLSEAPGYVQSSSEQARPTFMYVRPEGSVRAADTSRTREGHRMAAAGFDKLDVAAYLVAAVMTIGPLFAAMVGRM